MPLLDFIVSFLLVYWTVDMYEINATLTVILHILNGSDRCVLMSVKKSVFRVVVRCKWFCG